MMYNIDGKLYTRKELERLALAECKKRNYNYNDTYPMEHNCERHAYRILNKLGFNVVTLDK